MNVLAIKCRKNTGLGPRAVSDLAVSLLFLAWAGLGPAPQALAQSGTVRGTVVSADSGLPLQDAHVFVASSLLGTTTDAAGQYILKDIPPGAHRLYVSMLGYAPASRDTLIRANRTYEIPVRLQPATVQLEEVVVSARQARKWQRQLIKFERLFLGETDNSKYAKILNPEVLSFTSRLGKLNATASAPLEIENRALGYHIQYYLKEFFFFGNTLKYDGEPSFIELEPSDSLEAAYWKERRRIAFFGSQRHFILSLMDRRTEAEGFEVYRRYSLDPGQGRFGTNTNALLEPGPTPLEQTLTFNGVLEIVYTGEFEDEAFKRWQRMPNWTRPGHQRSFMELNSGPTLIDEAGEVIDPYGVTVYGYYAFERIADQVPKEFRPAEWQEL